MSTPAVEVNPLAEKVSFTKDDLVVELVDSRTVTVPLAWFPKLVNATSQQ